MEGDVETRGVQGFSDSEAKRSFIHWAVNANCCLKTGTGGSPLPRGDTSKTTAVTNVISTHSSP